MNRLAGETSPYLRQHADNPVDWFPFGEEAFALALASDRPVLLSIGYSACHWCHVMAHESFEDPAVAAALNARFVAVKVDREERPDVDAIYMEAVQALTGGGGWPLTVFTTADGRPFFGGTYFPPTPRHGAPSFTQVLDAVADAWTDRRALLLTQADELTAAVATRLTPPAPPEAGIASAERLLDAALARFSEMFDAEYGGVGRAPKFPQAPMLELVLRAHLEGHEGAAEMLTTTLLAMASGGIYDHLGGGFCRYATDRAWMVPHFEKMLYDQAALARVYLHTWQVTGDARFRQVVDETIAYLLRDLRDPSGALRSAEDADSAGEEGLFYTWTPEEITAVLGADAAVALDWYGVDATPNFEHGRSILHRRRRGDLLRPAEVEHARAALFAARTSRVRPGIDDKVLTEWNAMAASMLAEAAAATGTTAWERAAIEITEVLLGPLRRADGRLLRSYTGGRAAHLGVAADYAWTVECCTRLGELTGLARYTAAASELADQLIALFSAPDGGWYLTGADAPGLVIRPVDSYDGVTPSAGSVAAGALLRLGALTGEARFTERAEATIAATGAALTASPIALSHLVATARSAERGLVEVVIAGRRADLLAVARATYRPEVVLAWGEPTASPLFAGRDDDRAYVCRAGVCKLPTGDPDELTRLLAEAAAR